MIFKIYKFCKNFHWPTMNLQNTSLNFNTQHTAPNSLNKKENIIELVRNFDSETILSQEEENFLFEISEKVQPKLEVKEIKEKRKKKEKPQRILKNHNFEEYLTKLTSYKESCEMLKQSLNQLTETTNSIEVCYYEMFEKMEEYKDCEVLFFESVRKFFFLKFRKNW
jgi:hypothetical protein